MARPSTLSIAKEEILSFFNEAPSQIYTESKLGNILSQNRFTWKLAQSVKRSDFISFLGKHGQLKQHRLHSAHYNQTILRYSWGKVSFYKIALSIKSRAYLCHATALTLHGLAQLNRKTIYLNTEQSAKPMASGPLSQGAIERAFSSKQRQSNLVYTSRSSSVIMVAGKNTNRLGVEDVTGPEAETLQVTNLERTLIDIVVRPAYAGGISQVLQAYRNANGRISIHRLISTLKQLDYLYPYHQPIGFLMEKAGYPKHYIDQLRAIDQTHDFYLAHGMHQPKYSKSWRLFYPSNFS